MYRKTKSALLLFLLAIISAPMLQSAFRFVDSGSIWGFAPSPNAVFTIESWWSGAYQRAKETNASEQVGFRPDFIRLNNQIEYSLFDKPNFWGGLKGKESCMWGRDYIEAYLGYDFIGDEAMALKMYKLKKLQDTLTAMGKTVVVVYAPSKAYFFKECFPDEYAGRPRRKSANLDVSLRLADSLGINHIDLNGWFLQLKTTTKQTLFPKYSIHWSVYGAELGADTLIKYIERKRNITMPRMTFNKMIYTTKPLQAENDLILPMNLFKRIEEDTFCHPEISFTCGPKCEKPKAIYIGDSFTWPWFEVGVWKNVHKDWIYWNYFKRANHGRAMYDDNGQPKVGETNWIADLQQTDCVILVYAAINVDDLGSGFIEKAYDHYYPTAKKSEM